MQQKIYFDYISRLTIRRVQLFYLVRNDLLKTEWIKRVAINPES